MAYHYADPHQNNPKTRYSKEYLAALCHNWFIRGFNLDSVCFYSSINEDKKAIKVIMDDVISDALEQKQINIFNTGLVCCTNWARGTGACIDTLLLTHLADRIMQDIYGQHLPDIDRNTTLIKRHRYLGLESKVNKLDSLLKKHPKFICLLRAAKARQTLQKIQDLEKKYEGMLQDYENAENSQSYWSRLGSSIKISCLLYDSKKNLQNKLEKVRTLKARLSDISKLTNNIKDFVSSDEIQDNQFSKSNNYQTTVFPFFTKSACLKVEHEVTQICQITCAV